MHRVVSQTMANVRRDRPVHLLGIGGVSDIFHGVSELAPSLPPSLCQEALPPLVYTTLSEI